MSSRRRRSAAVLRTLVKRLLLGLFGAQVAVVAVLSVIDARRKRVRPKKVTFPYTEPVAVPLGASVGTTFTYGDDLFAEMLTAIRGARRRVMFESYIFKGDVLGREFKRALVEAAERGVEVYVVFDGFANLVVSRQFKRFPDTVHVLCYPAFRWGLLLLNIRKSGRDHRKILVVDDEIGFVGGYNIGSTYRTEWRDTHLKIVGPSVWDLENAFVDFWNMQRSERQPVLEDLGAHTWEARVRAHRNVPGQLMYPIRGMYLEAIDRAHDHIYITQAYFIPDREIVQSLLAAARRGVDVRILVPEISNHVVADWLSRGFYGTMLRGGISLLLYQNAMVHAKTATIDGRWSTIGTANFDRLSLSGNYEINVEVFDDALAGQMERIFAVDSGNARHLTLTEWTRRPFVAKFSELVLAPLRPLL